MVAVVAINTLNKKHMFMISLFKPFVFPSGILQVPRRRKNGHNTGTSVQGILSPHNGLLPVKDSHNLYLVLVVLNTDHNYNIKYEMKSKHHRTLSETIIFSARLKMLQ